MFFFYFTAEQTARFDRCLDELENLFGESGVYFADGLITFLRNLSFFDDLAFRDAVETAGAGAIEERSLIWRLHVMIWAAKQALCHPGDFVECGVYQGFFSRAVVEYLKFQTLDRRYYLYDIFDHQGDSEGSGIRMPMHGRRLEERVRKRFAGFDNVTIVAGRVPESFAQAIPERIAFLHIDMNDAEAELAALTALWPRLSPGALVLFDDYGWMAYRPQMIAIRAFLRERDVMVMELPTGQGLALKPFCQTYANPLISEQIYR